MFRLLRWLKSLFGSKTTPDYSAQVHEMQGRINQWSTAFDKQRNYYETKLRQQEEQFKADNKKSLTASRATTRGIISEELSPLIPGWGYSFSDTRHWGVRPFDFVVLDGLEADTEITVRFVEVKTGTSQQPNVTEKKLRDAINAGRVTFEIFNFTKATQSVQKLK